MANLPLPNLDFLEEFPLLEIPEVNIWENEISEQAMEIRHLKEALFYAETGKMHLKRSLEHCEFELVSATIGQKIAEEELKKAKKALYKHLPPMQKSISAFNSEGEYWIPAKSRRRDLQI
mmetsp:Transcript_12171/g.19804  ORF Transcript_12171/g.19804 Transcript_12171/m.19804 type:complete len:120 (-) Transcript_12171:2382-2741(-)